MVVITVTDRKLNNTHTNVDLYVPQYKVESGLIGGSVTYQVLVVSNLPHFKYKEHKPEQTVQFTISHKYQDFEHLHSALDNKFRSAVLPKLANKSFHLGDNHTLLKERLGALDTFMKYVAQSPRLSQSRELLLFLGVSKSKIIQIGENKSQDIATGEDEESRDQNENLTDKVQGKKEKLSVFDSDESDEADEAESKQIFTSAVVDVDKQVEEELLAEAAGKQKIAASLVFQADLDIDVGHKSAPPPDLATETSQETTVNSELDDILGVEDNLNDLVMLEAVKPVAKPRPPLPAKPVQHVAKPRPPLPVKPVKLTMKKPESIVKDSSFTESSTLSTSALTHEDVSSYIDSQLESSATDVNLFD